MTAPKHYEPWSDEDKALLKRMFEEHEPLLVIAQTLGRSATSVVGQLVALKLIYFWREDQCYYPYKAGYVAQRSLKYIDRQLEEIQNVPTLPP